jgi:hypothetical protein
MDSIENLKTDANIANILQKLKSAKPGPEKKEPSTTIDTTKKTNAVPSLMVPATEISVTSLPKKEFIKKEPDVKHYLDKDNIDESVVLPWLKASDRDLKLLHYITFDDSGNLVYNTIKTDRPANDLASLKLRDNYVCDINYYKSRHYVLYVKQFESTIAYSRTFTPVEEGLEKVPTEDISLQVANDEKYDHYVVFTDLGIADFIVKKDDVAYPYLESNLSKWFEEVSNYHLLQNANYEPNPRFVDEDLSNKIRDFKYDIITMPRPGIITLDSVDNSDQDYKLHLTLKDEFSFLPLKRVLGCLRYYTTHSDKSFDDFKRFVNKYFNII